MLPFLCVNGSQKTSNESERKRHQNRVTVDSAILKNIWRNLDVFVGSVRRREPSANVTRRQVIMPAVNLAVNSFPSDALANVAKRHEIYPAKYEHDGADSIESL